MDENAEDFCGNTDGTPELDASERRDFDLTADQEAHLAAGGVLNVHDTRRKFLKRGGKLAVAIVSLGVLGKLTVEKAEAATCAELYCPFGKYWTGRIDNRTSPYCSGGHSCWHEIKCYYDSTHYSYVWCRAYCGYC